MSGKYELDNKIDAEIKRYIENEPEILTEYYYSLIGSGKSYNTTKTYIRAVIKFIHFLFPNKTPPDDFYINIEPLDVEKYISSLRTKTINGKIKKTSDSLKTCCWSSLNSFFQFLIPKYMSSNPVEGTVRPKMKDNPKVTYLTENEIRTVIGNIGENANIRMRNRDLCLFQLGVSTGIRISAIVQIDLNDIDLFNNTISVIEKGDKNFEIKIGENLKNQILLWLDDRKKYFDTSKSDALFLSQEGKRISSRSVRDLLLKYSYNINKHVTPHVMRHSCATNLYEKTGDVYLCASQLHHVNVATTQRYVEILNSKKEYAVNILDKLI